MNPPKITVLIVNYNSSAFTAINLYALKKLTKNEFKTIILDNGSPIKDYRALRQICSRYENCTLERRETELKGSIAHGDGLNYLFDKIDTLYFCIIDPDAIWLMKNWDEVLISRLNDKIKIIGTQAPLGGKKYLDFPIVFAALFETETFKKLSINCLPDNPQEGRDVCWELKPKYLAAGYNGEIMETKNTRTFKDGPFRNVICAEFYLKGFDNIFANHFGRGSSGGAAKYSKNVMKILSLPGLRSLSIKYIGWRETRQWIKIAKKIIDSQ